MPPQPPMLEVQLADYDFVFDDPVPSGRLVVEVANVGEAAHELVLAPMPDGAGGDVEELVASEERRLLSPIYSTAQHQPGETGRFAVNLGPGRYLLACFLADDGGTPHYEKGMLAELTVE